ncbi:MAG: hypothetical protein ACYCVZ_01640 [Streptosporangiaceae bacterium]
MDQLSLSAWLPAAMLVGVGSVLAGIHGQTNLDLGAAIVRLTKAPLGILIVLLFALVLTTMITQAFGFEAIRFLEGYWGTAGSWLARKRIEHHFSRREALEDARRKLELDAFTQARQKMISGSPGPDQAARMQTLTNILELAVMAKPTAGYPEPDRIEALEMGWRDAARPADLSKIDAVSRRLAQYPEGHRILPTRLGNVLRSAEDKLRRADKGDLEGIVMRNYQLVPPLLLDQHSQFRTRLDMYCTLVFIFVALALAGTVTLWKFGTWHGPALLAAATFLALADLSYHAAISSAIGYGTVLAAIDHQITMSPRPSQR